MCFCLGCRFDVAFSSKKYKAQELNPTPPITDNALRWAWNLEDVELLLKRVGGTEMNGLWRDILDESYLLDVCVQSMKGKH